MRHQERQPWEQQEPQQVGALYKTRNANYVTELFACFSAMI